MKPESEGAKILRQEDGAMGEKLICSRSPLSGEKRLVLFRP